VIRDGSIGLAGLVTSVLRASVWLTSLV